MRWRRGATAAALLALATGVFATAAFGAIPVVDDCHDGDYQDRTGDGARRTVTWDFSFTGGQDRCLKIRAGQSVRWNGNFLDHPLDPDQGDSPNPISTHDADGVVRFDNPGVFGFRCNYHFEMRGAIQVVAGSEPVAVPWARVAGQLGLASLLLLVGVLAVWRSSRARHVRGGS